MRKIRAILDKTLSKHYEDRYVLIDAESEEVVDDAQGYGFKTVYGAYAAWAYKNRDREEEIRIHQFLNNNKKILELYDAYSLDNCTNIETIKRILKELEINSPFNIKKIFWGIKDFKKIEKNIAKGKYVDVINSCHGIFE